MRVFAIAILTALVAGPALSEEKPVQLKKAPGLAKVEANCGACHSLDYIVMNSPFQNAAAWDATVAKMIKAFGAPIEEADAKIIVEYLENNYGEGRDVAVPPPHARRQAPDSQVTARPARAAPKDMRHKSSPARKVASGRDAGRVNRRSAYVAGSSYRPGLLDWLRTHVAGSPMQSTAGASGYQCWQDEGYGRRTPCGAGASSGGGGDGGGGGGDGGGSGMSN